MQSTVLRRSIRASSINTSKGRPKNNFPIWIESRGHLPPALAPRHLARSVMGRGQVPPPLFLNTASYLSAAPKKPIMAKKKRSPGKPAPDSLEAALRNPRRARGIGLLGDREIKNFFELCDRFPNLRRLQIVGNRINRIPPNVFTRLPHLQSLGIMCCPLERLPASIGKLTRLERLDLSANQLNSLPSSIGQLVKLKELELPDNEIRRLPSAVGNLARLEYLDAAGNRLDRVPRELFQCARLKMLHLPGNELKTIPGEIGQLRNLVDLHLNNNQLHKLPEELDTLRRLQTLRLHRNRLKTLPETLAGLSLKELTIAGNPLSTETKRWVSRRFSAILCE